MSQWPSDHRYLISVAPGPDVVKVTIDGREVEAPRGELLIKVAQEHGNYIPRFCYHERMKPVGMCRMCLVEVEGLRGFQISCATPVTDGMVVHTDTPAVKAVQDGVLEFLLINHPLDCPVCDRGGECPLQDQTLAFGPGESRFVEEKRHFEKPIPISELVLLDRERCIQCGRCTRFAAEVAGDPLIDFGGRGDRTEVITYPDEPFASYFSGNIVQICPVGALTARPYRFKARPWDLATVETSCEACSVGCRGALESASNRLVRLLGVDSEPVNQGWLCDKGRYGYEYVHSEARLERPRVRHHADLVETSWPEALDAAASALREVVSGSGPTAVAVLGGSSGTNEDAYAWARFAKGVLRTDNVDAQLGDGLPAEVVLGVPRATISDLDRAKAIVLLGPDLKNELPVLFLRVRRAAVDLDVPLIDVSARDHGLTKHATSVLRHLPGEEGATVASLARALAGESTGLRSIDDIARHLEGRDGPVVVVLGRSSVAQPAASVVHAASKLSAVPGVRFLSALPRPNVHGALDLGLAPGFLPGRVTLDAGYEHFTDAWGGVPELRGLDAEGILRAAADGSIEALVLVDVDPLADFPDRALASAALANCRVVVSVGSFADGAATRADIVLPTTVWGEHAGSASNLEGRVQRLGRKVTPERTAMPAWRVATELALRFGSDFDLETVEEVQREIAALAPAFAGVDDSLLRRARDGVVLPVADHPEELHFGPAGTWAGVSWEPIPPAPVEAAGEVVEGEVVEGGAEPADTDADATTPAASSPSTGGEDADGAGTAAPVSDLYRWSGDADAVPSVPVDAYALRLVAGRTLYGSDQVVVASPSLARLARGARLLIHPYDRDRLGVADGQQVRVTTGRGSVELHVQGDPDTPQGTAFVAINQAGPGAGDLIDLSQPVTDLRVETVW
jgi:NADH-quinone oxidoreductase subunit G